MSTMGAFMSSGIIINYIFHHHIVVPNHPNEFELQKACVEFIFIALLYGWMTPVLNYMDHVLRKGWAGA